MANDELFKLTWNGHSGAFFTIFETLRSKAKYTDVTLACEGKLFAVHRLVLASCSHFFDSIFEQTPAENTVIVLNEANQQDIESLIDYMYSGQVEVPHSQLTSFLNTAGSLQIKGLTKEGNELGQQIMISGQKNIKCQFPPLKKRKCEQSSNEHLKPSSSSNCDAKKMSEVTTSCSQHSSDIIPDEWQQFQRRDLPNTTWSSSYLAKEKKNIPEASARDFADESLDKILDISDSHLHHQHPLEKTLHRVPETGGMKIFSPLKEELRKLNDQEDAMNYANEPLDYKKEIKNEYREELITDEEALENGSEFVSSPEIYEHFDSYSDTYESHGAQSPNMSPHPSKHHPSAVAIKFATDHNISVPSSVWSNSVIELNGRGASSLSTVSPRLMPFAKCSNCLTNNTKLWRRNMKGEIVCNACGLYFKLHGINRPNHLFRNAPMTRRRNPRKKKKNYEEILDAREQQPNNDEPEPYYNDGGCDSDNTQDGLAVINAALTLNSLFVKAKQEAATKNSNMIRGTSSSFESPRSSPAPVNSPSMADVCRPPPPLLKLPMRPPVNPISFSQELPLHGSPQD